MATELGYVKSKESASDGTNKTCEYFQLDMANQMTHTATAAKGEAERQASAAMLTIIERSTTMTVEQSKNLVYTGRRWAEDGAVCDRLAVCDPCDEHHGKCQGDREGGDQT